MPKICRDSEHTGIFSLGRLEHSKTIKKFLYQKANHTSDFDETEADVTLNQINQEVEDSFKKDNFLKFRYGKDGNSIEQLDTDATEAKYAFACFPTSFRSKNNNQLYIIYRYTHPDQSNNNNGWIGIQFETLEEFKDEAESYSIGLLKFATRQNANIFITELEKLLLPGEFWNFDSQKYMANHRLKTDYNILESYIGATISKIILDYYHLIDTNAPQKEIDHTMTISTNYKNDSYALFNTGLLSEYGDDILLLVKLYHFNPEHPSFTMNHPMLVTSAEDLNDRAHNKDKSPIFGEKMTQIDSNELDKITPTQYLTKQTLKSIIFDPDIEIVGLDTQEFQNHFFKDNNNRLPYGFKDNPRYANIALKAGIDLAIRNARRNYKYIVPQYRVKARNERNDQDPFQFLIPIVMDTKNINLGPSFALIVDEENRQGGPVYVAKTIISLEMAYNNARVICKPDDSWLNRRTLKITDPSI
ncbi:hypothetical protein IV38_GL001020 [Lactobacillus selangorensis]|uniref:DUF3825 domain-containing protein n=1 Tax=Lactobacillus selangorensis TaxID=81857 RepID=A0A0R2FJH5_9LACO|nr:DUF3825 domain-containing protein [Lactobacillus selangorensis]KRN28815.1 hypothetical protein IV38_GL001020 [Lactobacillus selangorensis]KRN32775.1 hypothetical protein IV40_GL000833 [Lactobacillus selangorensis]